MIVTVSTVKDNLHNVQRFVERNLAGGADHLLIFLDAAEPEVEAWLAQRPEVTTVVTDKTWWRGARPKLLNRRQNINANLALTVLRDLGWTDWLFHVDADEVVRIDRAVLAGVPTTEPTVRLLPLEVVGVLNPDGEPTQFKRLLEEDELELLVALDLLAEPTNSRYFRSHIIGKVGVRPDSGLWLGIHRATNAEGNRVLMVRDPGLAMLHFEAYSGAEFTRKWTNMISAGPSMNFGTHRQGLAHALETLVGMDLPDQIKARHLDAFYQRHMADPVDELASLGLLEQIDPDAATHVPDVLSEVRRRELAAALEAMRSADKNRFIPPKPADSTADAVPATEPPTSRTRQLVRALRKR